MPSTLSSSTSIITILEQGVINGIKALYDAEITKKDITMSPTRKEIEGDYTVVTFPFARVAKKKPDVIAEELGEYLQKEIGEVESYNVIKGFLNLVLSDQFWQQFLLETATQDDFGQHPAKDEKVMVEYCSPNTNKPLHLGHIRNILLGWSTSRILEAAGYEVVRVQIINDRGIAICKSMLAWERFGEGKTPESEGVKSDHFVGQYYVLFEQKFQEEYKTWQRTERAKKIFSEHAKKEQDEATFFKAFKNTYFNEYSELGKAAKEMLLKWEEGDPDVRALWAKMNGWVYSGFEETFERLGVTFDKYYYESDTYLLGKETIEKGLQEGAFYKKEDGSVWIDLTEAKLDHKLVLRSDGTSVYMTQDLGTARLRYDDYGTERMVYVVGDEQNYHFQVLFEILKRLEEPYAEGLYHLSYGMVDLPTGRMKSREGTVVDADDLIAEVIAEARKNAEERGELSELTPEQQEDVLRKIGLAALKFFIVKVQPQKRMVFNPAESVDMQGQTGPYVQNAFVRIQSILRKGGAEVDVSLATNYPKLETAEKDLIALLYQYPEIVQQAADEYDSSTVANYCYDLAKAFHKFYHDYSILRAETDAAKAFRLQLAKAVAKVLEHGMDLLGIEMPERM